MFVSIPLNNQVPSEKIVYNESTKVFELVDGDVDPAQMKKSWKELKSQMEMKFNKNEKLETFSIKDGFLKDLVYLKAQNRNLRKNTFKMLKQWSEKTQVKFNKIKNPNNEELSTQDLTKQMKKQLILEAQRVRTYAYAPYSKFHVGSAILTKDGNIYSGCNYENAAYGNTICAERSAIAKALSAENRGISFQKNSNIIAIAIVIRGGGGSPCGNCRQALYEFNPNMLVIMSDIDGENIVEKPLHKLLPMGFGPSNLDNAIVE